jgi:hypothetical protein
LDALELAQTEANWELNSPTRKFLRNVKKSIRAALAQPEPAAPTEPAPGWCKHCQQYTIDEPLPAAPTVVETDVPEISCGNMEPVAWMWRNTKTGARGVYFEDPEQFFALPANGDYEWTSLVAAHPPQAALSDEQIRNLWFAEKPIEDGRPAYWNFARAVEAAHGIGGPRNE